MLSLDQAGLAKALQVVPAYIGNDMEISAVVALLKAFNINIERYWKVNEKLFDMLTKNELDAVCVELGLDKAIGKDYAKVKNGSKADFIKAALAVENFDYMGKVPRLMRW
jgi:ParB family chromosome partitioning protein